MLNGLGSFPLLDTYTVLLFSGHLTGDETRVPVTSGVEALYVLATVGVDIGEVSLYRRLPLVYIVLSKDVA